MHKISLLVLVLLLNISCTGKKSAPDLYAAKDETVYSKFINSKTLPASPNLTIDKSFVNNDYPIEIALYEDHRFFYNLPNLGTGKGTWKFQDGKIQLKAKRSLFDMHIEVYGADQNHSNLAIQFTDRFGPNSLVMENSNI